MSRPSSPAPRVFGDAAVDGALAEWLDTNHLELVEAELLETGGSGGKLVSAFVRELDDRRSGGMRIIKLVGPSPDAEAEPRNHRAALLSRVPGNEVFIDRHLVGLAEKAWRLGDHWVMFQCPAGDGKDETTTLATLGRVPHLPGLAARIVRGVLSGWNPEDPEFSQGMTAARFVSELLGARLDDKAPLRTWVRDRVDARAGDRLWFSLTAEAPVLPDPLALSDGSPLSEHPVRFAARGRGHGDLHPGNIMAPVRTDASPDDYWLIDLSRFSDRALLARDPVHLLLCLIADEYLPHLSEAARAELMAVLSAPDPGPEPRCDGPLVPQGLADLVGRVRAELIEWGASRRFGPAWQAQWFLALHACSLMVTARDRYPDRDRWWFYLLAAHACGAYLDSVKVKRPLTAEIVSPPVLGGRVVEAEEKPAPVAVPDTAVVRRGETVVAEARATAGTLTVPPPGPQAVTEILRDISKTFESPLRHVSASEFGRLKADVVLFAQRRASQLAVELSMAQLAAAAPASAGGGDAAKVDGVLALLSDVTTTAVELRKAIVRREVGLKTPTTPGRPRQQEYLVQALTDLLDGVRGRLVALGAC